MNRVAANGLLLVTGLALGGTALAQLQTTSSQYWHQGSPGVGVQPEEDAEFGRALSVGDYNCDGLDDAAFGMPNDDLVGATDGGRVLVLYAENSIIGLSAEGRQVWGQAGPAVPGDPSPFESFGLSLASGDFDNDGCDDLAIGVPFDDVEGLNSAGGVNVLYGSPGSGLSDQNIDYWHQGGGSAGGALEANDNFGRALAVGDFDDDGFDDLAIGIPGEGVGSGPSLVSNAGAVQVLFGGSNGLSASQDVILVRGSNLFGEPVAFEQIGSVLAAGDINQIAGDELVIGIPDYDISAALTRAGAIMVVSDIDGNVFNVTYTQDSEDIPGVAEEDDQLGDQLAVGDFDGDGFDEIAATVRGEGIGQPPSEIENAGAVNVFNFSNTDGHQLWTQDEIPSIPQELPEAFDRFGSALVSADFDGDGLDDLAIGVSREDFNALSNPGLVQVLYSVENEGLTAAGAQTFRMIVNPPGNQDNFGDALAAGTINGGNSADLVVGAPGDTISEAGTGSAVVLYSAPIDSLFGDRFEDD